jgi:two-component system chemotaxis sensor kinase CheA
MVLIWHPHCVAIRSTAQTPVIGLCSSISPETFERGKRVGMCDYVAKFDRRGLIAALKNEAAGASSVARA